MKEKKLMYKHTLNVHDVERTVRRVQYVNVGKKKHSSCIRYLYERRR